MCLTSKFSFAIEWGGKKHFWAQFKIHKMHFFGAQHGSDSSLFIFSAVSLRELGHFTRKA